MAQIWIEMRFGGGLRGDSEWLPGQADPQVLMRSERIEKEEGGRGMKKRANTL